MFRKTQLLLLFAFGFYLFVGRGFSDDNPQTNQSMGGMADCTLWRYAYEDDGRKGCFVKYGTEWLLTAAQIAQPLLP
jgi:hypothetical protein